jgi:cysteine desulfurase
MGCSVERARSSVRFSFGIYNTEAEVDYALKHLPGIIAKLRSNAPATHHARKRHEASHQAA